MPDSSTVADVVRAEAAAIERTTIDDAYAQLRAGIVSGALLPLERLVEADLAASLGVSRATVRAVLARLEQDGLVERQPNRGARVRLVRAEEAVEIVEARAALEGIAARHAALRATADDRADLRRILGNLQELQAARDYLGYSATNARLHARLLQISGNRTVAKLIDNLQSQVVRYQHGRATDPVRLEQSLAEHTAIVEAVEQGDAIAAEQAMRSHLFQVVESIEQMDRHLAPGSRPLLRAARRDTALEPTR